MSNSFYRMPVRKKIQKLLLFFFVMCTISMSFLVEAHAYFWGKLDDTWYYLGSDYQSNEWENEEQVDEAIRAINEIRLQYGKKPLVKDQVLMDAAEVRAREIVTKFDHFRPDGTRPYTATYGIYEYVGENLAQGQSSTAEVMQDWMNSPDHKKNIFHDGYEKIGLATYKQNGRTYWVHLFLAK